MKTIKKSYSIDASPSLVWKALVDPAEIDSWGAGKAEMYNKVGTHFKLWNGDIWDKNVEVVKDSKLVQEWYGGKWDKPSNVTITLREAVGSTIVELVHEGIPDDEAGDIDDGWDSYYFGPMKKYLENKH